MLSLHTCSPFNFPYKFGVRCLMRNDMKQKVNYWYRFIGFDTNKHRKEVSLVQNWRQMYRFHCIYYLLLIYYLMSNMTILQMFKIQNECVSHLSKPLHNGCTIAA